MRCGNRQGGVEGVWRRTEEQEAAIAEQDSHGQRPCPMSHILNTRMGSDNAERADRPSF